MADVGDILNNDFGDVVIHQRKALSSTENKNV